jgi:putative transposase
MKYLDRFHPNGFYHVFNHAVGKENLFRSHENFLFFLARFNKYISPVGKTFCYCLMPNHFHFLIQIRDEQSIMKLANIDSDDNFDYHKFIMQRLSNFLNSYAKAFNKQQGRMGALFIDYTKRIQLNDDGSFTAVVNYIHRNPINHGFCKSISVWKYSSYNSIVENELTFLERETLLDWFGGLNNFIDFHKSNL